MSDDHGEGWLRREIEARAFGVAPKVSVSAYVRGALDEAGSPLGAWPHEAFRGQGATPRAAGLDLLRQVPPLLQGVLVWRAPPAIGDLGPAVAFEERFVARCRFALVPSGVTVWDTATGEWLGVGPDPASPAAAPAVADTLSVYQRGRYAVLSSCAAVVGVDLADQKDHAAAIVAVATAAGVPGPRMPDAVLRDCARALGVPIPEGF